MVVYILLHWEGHYPSIENSGTFDNRGFEITVKHRNHIGKFNYSLNGNLSFARNKILRMTQADNKPWQNRLGTSVGTIWGLKSLGLYQTQAVTLQEDINSLDEVVVVGYGTPEKDPSHRIHIFRYLLKNY
ncbi:hypothetical protein NXW97_24250 [Bacteroides faecis]|uniref:Uncharacterized protein n=1 Tax=Bacteroides faecis TaxID=674529 RepID=A0AAW5P2V3_9BACE|nr:hypothetical protein [Bacteroides faecis]MCS2795065.1 hypothetical protein [Bacteroides faecis]